MVGVYCLWGTLFVLTVTSNRATVVTVEAMVAVTAMVAVEVVVEEEEEDTSLGTDRQT